MHILETCVRCRHTHTHACMHACIHIHTYVYAYIHTYTYTGTMQSRHYYTPPQLFLIHIHTHIRAGALTQAEKFEPDVMAAPHLSQRGSPVHPSSHRGEIANPRTGSRHSDDAGSSPREVIVSVDAHVATVSSMHEPPHNRGNGIMAESESLNRNGALRGVPPRAHCDSDSGRRTVRYQQVETSQTVQSRSRTFGSSVKLTDIHSISRMYMGHSKKMIAGRSAGLYRNLFDCVTCGMFMHMRRKEDEITRLVKDLRMLSRLRHPNITT